MCRPQRTLDKIGDRTLLMELVQHSSSSIGSCFGRNLIFSTVAQTLWSRRGCTIMVKYFSHFSTVGQRVPGGGGCVAGLVWLVYGVAGVWPVWCGWCVARKLLEIFSLQPQLLALPHLTRQMRLLEKSQFLHFSIALFRNKAGPRSCP